MRRIFFRKTIVDNAKLSPIFQREIGHIFLVENPSLPEIPEIQYRLDKDFRKKGIMSREIRKYIARCKKFGIQRMIAVVKKNNRASLKLLIENNFVKISESEKLDIFALDFIYGKRAMEKAVDQIGILNLKLKNKNDQH